MKPFPCSKLWPINVVRRDRPANNEEAGLTLVECIMAIVVLGVVGGYLGGNSY